MGHTIPPIERVPTMGRTETPAALQWPPNEDEQGRSIQKDVENNKSKTLVEAMGDLCITCQNAQGSPRTHNGSPCGIHCTLWLMAIIRGHGNGWT